jgi:hypothetical protein
MVGGAFLCYEGFEKLTHKFLHSKDEDAAHHAELVRAVSDPALDLVALEKEKIKGAVRTDLHDKSLSRGQKLSRRATEERVGQTLSGSSARLRASRRWFLLGVEPDIHLLSQASEWS